MVILDSTAGSATSGAAVQTFTYTPLTVGTRSCRGLVAILNFALKTVTGVACTWDGIPMTAITGAIGTDTGANGLIQMFGLLNPNSGAKNLIVNWTGVTQLTMAALSFNGVDQTSIAAAFPNGTSNTGSSLTTSLNITSGLDHMVVASHVNNTGNAWTAVNNNQLYVDNSPALIDCAGNYANGSASVSMTATATSGTPAWVSVGTDVSPDPLSSQIWM